MLQIQVANGSIKRGHAEDDLSDAFALGHGWGGGPGIFNYYFCYYCSTIIAISYGAGQHSVPMMTNISSYYYNFCFTIITLLAIGWGSTLYLHRFSKVLATMDFYSRCARVLTF